MRTVRGLPCECELEIWSSRGGVTCECVSERTDGGSGQSAEVLRRMCFVSRRTAVTYEKQSRVRARLGSSRRGVENEFSITGE